MPALGDDDWLDVPTKDPATLKNLNLLQRRLAHVERTRCAERWVYWWRMFISEGRFDYARLHRYERAMDRLSAAVLRLDTVTNEDWRCEG
jgi:hypothetical protein